MSALDWTVFALFLGWIVYDGMRRAGSGRDLEGYFAGSRRIPWWAAGLSIMATQASAITVIGTTGQGHDGGLGFVQFYFGLPFAMIVLCVLFVPLYRRVAILTPYEYLETRFGPATRVLTSLVFLGSRCLALGVVIYAPAVALSAMLGIETGTAVLVIGALTTLYTMVGGLAAVIWTDVKQIAVIVLGLLCVAAILLRDLWPTFSCGQMLDLCGAAGKLEAVTMPEGSWLPRTLADAAAGIGTPSIWEPKYTLFSGLVGGLFLQLAYFGCDHSQAQRLLTSANVRDGRLSLLLSAFAKLPLQLGVLALGVLMWLFYALHGQPLLYKTVHVERAASAAFAPIVQPIAAEFEQALAQRRELMLRLAALPGGPRTDPALLADYQDAVAAVQQLRARAREAVALPGESPGDRDDTNDIFCRFILDELPPIVLGLVIAAIFAAAMSSIDSVLNALSAATIVDHYRRWLRPRCSEAHAVAAGKVVTLCWGALATLLALYLGGGGSVVERINLIGSFFYGSLLGVFVLALAVRRAGELAAVTGLVAGMAAVLVVWQTLRVEFLWFNVVGCAVVLVVGGLVARVVPARR